MKKAELELTENQKLACKDLGISNPMVIDQGEENYYVIDGDLKNLAVFSLYDINNWMLIMGLR